MPRSAFTAPSVSSRLAISGIPTLLLMQGGREVARTSGAMDAKTIVAWTMTGSPGPNDFEPKQRNTS
jgi:thioredoxin-like negative regulator of GroEL